MYVHLYVCVFVCVWCVCVRVCVCVSGWEDIWHWLPHPLVLLCMCVCVCVCLCVCHKIHVHAFYLLMNSINGGSCSLLDFYMLAQGVLATSSVCHIIYYIGIM